MAGDAGAPDPAAGARDGAAVDGPVWLHGVVRVPLAGRARHWFGSRGDGPGAGAEAERPAEGLDGTRRVRAGQLSAVVSPVADGEDGPPDADARLERHARVVEALAGSGAVVPAPPGVRARDEAAVRTFLDRARLALEEALDLFDGACEMRLHVRRHPVRRATDPPSSAAADDDAAATAAGLYQLLRRQAQASRRLPPAGGDVLTAAFLVPRAGWSEGADLVARWQRDRTGLEAELTGPWAPYDFVRMFPVEGADPPEADPPAARGGDAPSEARRP